MIVNIDNEEWCLNIKYKYAESVRKCVLFVGCCTIQMPAHTSLIAYSEQIKLIVWLQALQTNWIEYSDKDDLWPTCLLTDASNGYSPGIFLYHSPAHKCSTLTNIQTSSSQVAPVCRLSKQIRQQLQLSLYFHNHFNIKLQLKVFDIKMNGFIIDGNENKLSKKTQMPMNASDELLLKS